jgi:hypothetical protein
MAMGIRCRSGDTRLIDILARAEREKPKVVVYIGDCFEESQREAVSVAERLKAQGTRVIFLRDGNDRTTAQVFPKLAVLAGGAVLLLGHLEEAKRDGAEIKKGPYFLRR